MVTVKDLRSITPRTNGTRALSAIENIARHHSATDEGDWSAFWNYWNKTKSGGLVAITKLSYEMALWNCAMTPKKSRMV